MVPIQKLMKGLRVESQLLFCVVIKSYMYCDPVERLVPLVSKQRTKMLMATTEHLSHLHVVFQAYFNISEKTGQHGVSNGAS